MTMLSIVPGERAMPPSLNLGEHTLEQAPTIPKYAVFCRISACLPLNNNGIEVKPGREKQINCANPRRG